MIRTLFVEDEFFVRRGIIHSFPWDRFGISVVGEADNGESALEFLGVEKVDLMITDLTMPVMSGLELIRTAKSLYPDLAVVVLTCHRDFDFVQEALRLGALDYIVKTKLDTNEIEASLERIARKLAGRSARIQSGLFIRGRLPQGKVWLSDWSKSRMLQTVAVGADSWWIPDWSASNKGLAELVRELSEGGMSLLEVEGASAAESREIRDELICYARETLFYQDRWKKELVSVTWSDITMSNRKPRELTLVREHWLGYSWLFHEDDFDRWCRLVREVEPPVKELTAMLADSVTAWSVAEGLHLEGIGEPDVTELTCWSDWEEKLCRIRGRLQASCAKLAYSRDVLVSVYKSIDIIRERLKESVSQNEIARQVNLSRSYFSQVFKETFGMSFNEYMKEWSILTARKLLAATDHPVYWVAEQSGFMDERYFSRVFREKTGLLPSEYRGKAFQPNRFK